MAIESISSDLMTPVVNSGSPRSAQDAAPQSLEDLDISDPKLQTQKLLLKALFGVGEDDPEDGEQKPPKEKHDSVTISAEAIELYERRSGKVSVETSDGKLEIEFERVTALRIEAQQSGKVRQADPLVIDLNGNGIELTDVGNAGGVSFDLTGDGTKETTSWVSPADGLLALDRNGNGLIDGGQELFGDQHGAVDGFAELARFDQDLSRSIDQNDPVYDQLRVWQDLNQNGQSEQDELKPLGSYGIRSIGLLQESSFTTIAGNTVAAYGRYSGAAGAGQVGEVLLNYLA